MKPTYIVFGLLLLATLGGCSDPSTKQQLQMLQTTHELLISHYDALEKRVLEIETKQSLQEWDAADVGVFDVTQSGYAKITHNNGFLLVAFKGIAPHGDGQKLTFNFGNPLSSGFQGVKFKVRWKPRVAKGLKGDELVKALGAAVKQTQEQEVSLTDTLNSRCVEPGYIYNRAGAKRQGWKHPDQRNQDG